MDPADLATVVRDRLRARSLRVEEEPPRGEGMLLVVRGTRIDRLWNRSRIALAIRIEPDFGSTSVSVGEPLHGARSADGPLVPIVSSDWRVGAAADVWAEVDRYAVSVADGKRSPPLTAPPKHGIPPSAFAGRTAELTRVEEALQGLRRGRADHLAFVAGTGFGKSSILQKGAELAEKADLLTVRREVPVGMQGVSAVADFLLRAVAEEMHGYLSRTRRTIDWLAEFGRRHGWSFTVPGVASASLTPVASVTEFRENEFHRDFVRLLMQARENDLEGAVLLLDGTQRLDAISGGWAFLRIALARASEQRARVLLIAGYGLEALADPAAEVVLPERFLEVIRLEPMTPEETRATVDLALRVEGCRTEPETSTRIWALSGGHPYAVQRLAFEAALGARERGSVDVGPADLDSAVTRAIGRRSELVNGLFVPEFRALGLDERRAFRAIALSSEPLSTAEVARRLSPAPTTPISRILTGLANRGHVRVLPDGRYEASSQLWATYLRERTGVPGDTSPEEPG
jgi:hypothetical protein